jgi:hypothetical protein
VAVLSIGVVRTVSGATDNAAPVMSACAKNIDRSGNRWLSVPLPTFSAWAS